MCRILRVLLKRAVTFSPEIKTDNVRPRKKIPSRSFLLWSILEKTKSFLFLSTELSSTELSWMSLTQGTWTGNKQNNGKMKNENRTKNGWWVTDRARVYVSFSSYFWFSRCPQFPAPVPRFSNMLLRLGLVTAYLKVRRTLFTLVNAATGKWCSIAALNTANLSFDELLGRISNHDGNGSENASFKSELALIQTWF